MPYGKEEEEVPFGRGDLQSPIGRFRRLGGKMAGRRNILLSAEKKVGIVAYF